MSSRAGDEGELALVLHTHMPYVEGFGTWPSGEEWLWEAMATCYLPLLDSIARFQEAGSPLTLSLTPVLCDQLEADGIGDRFTTFLRDVRADTHRLDIEGCRRSGALELVDELERAAGDYVAADRRFAAIGEDLLGALAPSAAWTSAATHAVLPLLATEACARLQVLTGVASHRSRFGEWRGGFWLPECAHAPWVLPILAEAGTRATCVDLTDVLGLGDDRHLRPIASEEGPLLVPIDRATIELVWSDRGYPAHATYRDYHHYTVHNHRPWANDRRPYDHSAALALAREHAADFVRRTVERLRSAHAANGRPGLCVCALDTELLGHWWYEGIAWLDAVLDEAERQGLTISALDDALDRHEPAEPAESELPVTTWGMPRDLSTWEGPPVADLAIRARREELRVVAAGDRAGERAVRELLLLQSSDWAFQVSRELAGPYPRNRADGHAEALEEALGAPSLDSGSGRLRNLAPGLAASHLRLP